MFILLRCLGHCLQDGVSGALGTLWGERLSRVVADTAPEADPLLALIRLAEYLGFPALFLNLLQSSALHADWRRRSSDVK